MELLALKAVCRLAIAQRVAEFNVASLFVFDQHIRATDSPAFVVVFLTVEAKQGFSIACANSFF